jgi:predicted RNase H-like HicB family nuclease
VILASPKAKYMTSIPFSQLLSLLRTKKQSKKPIRCFLPFLTAALIFTGFATVEARSPRRLAKTAPKPDAALLEQYRWKLFNPPDGRFSILMPGKPKVTAQTQKTFMGEINLQVFVAQPPKQDVAYVVAFNDFPDSYGQMANPEEVLKNAQDTALKTTQSSLLNHKSIRSSNGHPGREIEYINSGGKITKNRMYFAEGRLYQVMVVTTKRQKQFLTKSIAGYLNSFNVVLKK